MTWCTGIYLDSKYSRRLKRLGYLTCAVMCIYAFYLLYWDPGPAHTLDLTRQRLSQGLSYDVYGNNYHHKGKEDNSQHHLQTRQKTPQSEGQAGVGERWWWQGVVGGGVEEREDDGTEEDENFHEYGVMNMPALKDPPALGLAYTDTDLSENLMDIHQMDGVDMRLVHGLNVDLADVEMEVKEFHYPDVGYRYQNQVEGQANIPWPHPSPPHTLGNNIAEAKFSNNMEGKFLGVKAKPIRGKLTPTKKPKSRKSQWSDSFPPALDKSQNPVGQEMRYLVYQCDSTQMCGGWGDRQRGISSVYLLSRLTGRHFRIIMNTPCNLDYFYIPRNVQWQPVGDELVTDSNITINAFTNKNFKMAIMKGDFNARFSKKVVYMKTNQDYYERLKKNPFYSQMLTKWGGLDSRAGRFHWAWNDLMQPSPILLKHLEHIVGSEALTKKGVVSKPVAQDTSATSNSTYNIGDSPLICAHVRMGKNPTIPMDEDFASFQPQDLPVLFNFMSSKDISGDAKFFVATDYEHVRVEARKHFWEKLLDYGGKILHIDRQRSEHSACAGFEVALMDQLILSLCNVLVVSRSGFSIHAAYMASNSTLVYIMEEGNIGWFKG